MICAYPACLHWRRIWKERTRKTKSTKETKDAPCQVSDAAVGLLLVVTSCVVRLRWRARPKIELQTTHHALRFTSNPKNSSSYRVGSNRSGDTRGERRGNHALYTRPPPPHPPQAPLSPSPFLFCVRARLPKTRLTETWGPQSEKRPQRTHARITNIHELYATASLVCYTARSLPLPLLSAHARLCLTCASSLNMLMPRMPPHPPTVSPPHTTPSLSLSFSPHTSLNPPPKSTPLPLSLPLPLLLIPDHARASGPRRRLAIAVAIPIPFLLFESLLRLAAAAAAGRCSCEDGSGGGGGGLLSCGFGEGEERGWWVNRRSLKSHKCTHTSSHPKVHTAHQLNKQTNKHTSASASSSCTKNRSMAWMAS